jgi:hypothetical protein
MYLVDFHNHPELRKRDQKVVKLAAELWNCGSPILKVYNGSSAALLVRNSAIIQLSAKWKSDLLTFMSLDCSPPHDLVLGKVLPRAYRPSDNSTHKCLILVGHPAEVRVGTNQFSVEQVDVVQVHSYADVS